jgi:hypothetical protein
MDELHAQGSPADIPLRAHLAPPLTYGREAVPMSSAWYVLLVLYLLTASMILPLRRLYLRLSFYIECDKSFTRSDALAKHMRLQHSLSPPPPGRGGSKKRKRPEDDSAADESKIDPDAMALDADPSLPADAIAQIQANSNNNINGLRPPSPGSDDSEIEDPLTGPYGPSGTSSSLGLSTLPPHLRHLVDPSTGLVAGRPPSMVKYLVAKAKFSWLKATHESLVEELRVSRAQEMRWREAKDLALETLMRHEIG